jgi:uncharacterized protein YndB with AHSA1/START domain
MLARPQPASLVIADISGYTGYLAGVELDHAQDILADLIGTVVGGLQPTFRLSKLEGDAAFAYQIAETIDPSIVQDTVEATYFSFRRRLRDIKQASRCECNACVLIPSVDLKFVVHHGPVIVQQVAGQEELLGRDVILVHRLLKNDVVESTGIEAYALYTQACVDAMGVDPELQGLVRHAEDVEIIGPVTCWLRELNTAWAAEQERRRVLVTADDAAMSLTFETPAPPPLVWEYLTSPARRPTWSAGTDEVRQEADSGRRGIGTILEEILDWRPFDYWTTRSTMPVPGAPRSTMTQTLVPLPDGGTRVEVRVKRPEPDEREGFEQVASVIAPALRMSIANLGEALARESAALAADAAAQPRPPVSAGRYAAEPQVAVDFGGGRSSSG